MIDLKKLDGPFGIPVYHQRMPSMVKAVSMGWLMLTGAGDDVASGSPGLHHWFEHVPFRGTKKFPGGVKDLEGPFTSMNGMINAWTNQEATCYHGTVHESQWRQVLTVLTDMVANPLITTEGVEAERKIIHQEIAGSLGSAQGRAWYELLGMLYSGHPFGHPTLGSEKTLSTMDAATLRRAHKLGYDRSRAVFVCVGNMSEEELLHELEIAAKELPDHGLTARRAPAYFETLPLWKPGVTEVETEFAASIIMMLFPTTPNSGEVGLMTEASQTYALLDNVFEHGGMTAPLMRIVREERQLVYGCSTMRNLYPGGGFFGLKANAKKENIPAILDAFRDVLKDAELRSASRLADMKSSMIAEIEMMPIDPSEYLGKATHQFISCGGNMQSYHDIIDWMNKVTVDDIDARLSLLQPDDARIIVFKGMGKA